VTCRTSRWRIDPTDRLALSRFGNTHLQFREDGVLIYIKPILLGNEPPDVESYAAAFPEFPHQSTGDQWFDESQTESYRMLGLHTVNEICQSWDGSTWSELAEHVTTRYLSAQPPPISRAASATG